MKKILWLSDSPTTCTGYASITRKVLNDLQGDYDCHCLGHNFYSQTVVPPIKFVDGEEINFTMHGAGAAKYSMDKVSHLIRSEKIDIFGGLLDTFMMQEANFLNVDTSPARTFFYFPSDGGGGLPLTCENILKKVEMPIAMSKFGRDQVLKNYGIKSEYIPHAFDQKTFYPLSDIQKEENRIAWQLQGKFVVGTVARNQGRKMLDRTLKAFKLFCVDKPDAVLLMHCDANDPAQVNNLNELINRFQLNNRIIFTGTSFFNPFTYSKMNEVYNLMDIFFLSTSGEGFGIPIIEAMGCGIPQVVTDYTTTKELVEDDGKTGESVLLSGETEQAPAPHTNEILDGTLTGSWNVERGVMSIYDAEKKLTKLYNDRKLLKQYSDASYKKSRALYTWEKIMPMWRSVFERLSQ